MTTLKHEVDQKLAQGLIACKSGATVLPCLTFKAEVFSASLQSPNTVVIQTTHCSCLQASSMDQEYPLHTGLPGPSQGDAISKQHFPTFSETFEINSLVMKVCISRVAFPQFMCTIEGL